MNLSSPQSLAIAYFGNIFFDLIVLIYLFFIVVLKVCVAAVGLVGDIARALGSNIVSYSDLFMQILLENLAVS